MELELIDITRIVYVNSFRENERLLYFARKCQIDSHFTYIRTH